MLPDRRSHTTLPTADIEGLRRFYEDTLGFAPYAERPNAVVYRTSDGSMFAISRATVASRTGFTQMGFTVPDIEAEVDELRNRGVVFQEYETPRTVNGIATIGPGRAAWFQDPEGNVIALLEWTDSV